MTEAAPLPSDPLEVAHVYDEVAEHYDEEYRSRLDRAEDRFVARRIHTWPGQRVIDLGCGTGKAIELAGASYTHYVGIDLSKGMLRVARRRYPSNGFIHADMTEVPLQDESADLIVSLFGSCSYAPMVQVIDECFRLLAPGGKLLLMPLAKGRLQRPRPILAAEAVRWQTEMEVRALLYPRWTGISVVGLTPWWFATHPPKLGMDFQLESFAQRHDPDDCCYMVAEAVKPR